MSLASHIDKICSLDSLLAEHDIIKQGVSSLRELLDDEKRDLKQIRGGRRWAEPRQQHQPEDEDENLQHGDNNNNNAHSIATVTAHGLERIEEEHEDQLAVEEDEQSHRRDELTRAHRFGYG